MWHLGTWVSGGLGRTGGTVGLEDHGELFHLNDSVILCLFRVLTWAAKNSWNCSIFSFHSLVSLSTFNHVPAAHFYHLPDFVLTSHLWISYSSSTRWTPAFTDQLPWTLNTDTSEVQVHSLWQHSLPLPPSVPLTAFSPELAGNVLMLE